MELRTHSTDSNQIFFDQSPCPAIGSKPLRIRNVRRGAADVKKRTFKPSKRWANGMPKILALADEVIGQYRID
jgi:hypothetical protein